MGEVKLKRRHVNVLQALSDGLRRGRGTLPNGNGHAAGGHCASHQTITDLTKVGLIKWDCFGYGITPAGRAALKAESSHGA